MNVTEEYERFTRVLRQNAHQNGDPRELSKLAQAVAEEDEKEKRFYAEHIVGAYIKSKRLPHLLITALFRFIEEAKLPDEEVSRALKVRLESGIAERQSKAETVKWLAKKGKLTTGQIASFNDLRVYTPWIWADAIYTVDRKRAQNIYRELMRKAGGIDPMLMRLPGIKNDSNGDFPRYLSSLLRPTSIAGNAAIRSWAKRNGIELPPKH